MTHTERCTSIEEIRKKINPHFSDIIGTESFERKFLLDVIDELEAEVANSKVLYINKMKWASDIRIRNAKKQRDRIKELEAEVAELKLSLDACQLDYAGQMYELRQKDLCIAESEADVAKLSTDAAG